jgi:3-oxoacyl-[acyl-carrier-protein] synthase-3
VFKMAVTRLGQIVHETLADSVPLALDVGIRDGRIKSGNLILPEAFGGGLTWGSALVRL